MANDINRLQEKLNSEAAIKLNREINGHFENTLYFSGKWYSNFSLSDIVPKDKKLPETASEFIKLVPLHEILTWIKDYIRQDMSVKYQRIEKDDFFNQLRQMEMVEFFSTCLKHEQKKLDLLLAQPENTPDWVERVKQANNNINHILETGPANDYEDLPF